MPPSLLGFLDLNKISLDEQLRRECTVHSIDLADGGGLLHIFLDDCGNVVRQWRTDELGADDNYDGAWKTGMLKEEFMCGRGEVGSAYRPGV